ncbi:MAG: hypothetical protein QOD56_3204 [Gammaproteobacteria bacterium]|jgi:hypothetical protein|nr:hypothetical protein [Gammaproteobacteria bacterium]
MLHEVRLNNEIHVAQPPAACCNHRVMLQPQPHEGDPALHSRRPRAGIAGAALLLLLSPMAHGDWNVGADLRWRHDDNVGNAGYAADIVADSVISATLAASRFVPLGEGYSLNAAADLSGEYYDRIHGLNNAGLGGTLALKRKWGLGPYAPWVRLGVSVAHTDYEDDYRNASIYCAAAAAGRRIDDRWNFLAEYTFERRHASSRPEDVPGLSGDAFSQTSHNVALTAHFASSENTYLTAGLILRRGDVVSTTRGNLSLFSASRALADDPAFGPEAYAYRLMATSVGWKVGIHYAPAPHHSIGLGFLRLDTHASGDNDYMKSMPEITWNYSF